MFLIALILSLNKNYVSNCPSNQIGLNENNRLKLRKQILNHSQNKVHAGSKKSRINCFLLLFILVVFCLFLFCFL